MKGIRSGFSEPGKDTTEDIASPEADEGETGADEEVVGDR
jgi:hypothetical protein